jgi:transcriptional regulator with XRE-family HTH domain
MNQETISNRIKNIIKAHGGYDNVSEVTGINRQALIRIATGKTDPKLSYVIKLTELANMTVDELIHGEFADALKVLTEADRQRESSSATRDLIFNIRDKIMNHIYMLEDDLAELKREQKKQ